MKLIARIWGSSLGKKYLMAISGLVLLGFVIGHMIGNLQIFIGPEAINRYAYFLQHTPELLWPARIGLLAMVAIHLVSSLKLAQENRAARPVPYGEYKVVGATYASRAMLWTGLIIAAFVIYHLLHFTVQNPQVNLTGKDFRGFVLPDGRHDVYGMMVTGYQQPLVSAFYVLAIGLLCLHLSHGASSLFQSLGLTNQFYLRLLERVATFLAIIIFLGYCSIPAAVLLGVVK